MTNCPEDELSVQKQKCKKQLEEINCDLLTHQRSLEWLRTKLVILKSKANPSSKSCGYGILENRQKESHTILYDSDNDDDSRALFPCPFCIVDIDVSVLCSHLQEEHCFDLKNAVCPMCAANLGKDVIGHFIVQHASSLKRRRKSEKYGFLSGNSTMLGKKFPTHPIGNKHESTPDPLLSSFIYNMPFSAPKCIPQDECFREDASSATSDVKSIEPSSLHEDHEQDKEEKRKKAAFVQELIVSTIF
ncbi:protein DEHYDRATION-INDUCED 19 homolog 5-like isoform X1 [Castanea sativa]|uniref:protein DEHYDRATION-INDUCED 19 homolog 5-like isoform X1 n=1 Tax=Castanea sativa TaxID=21020 RepID=UPI003F64AD3D